MIAMELARQEVTLPSKKIGILISPKLMMRFHLCLLILVFFSVEKQDQQRCPRRRNGGEYDASEHDDW